MLKNPATYFLTMAQQKGKSPNFWMSEEYIDLAGLEWSEGYGFQGFRDEERVWIFPYFLTHHQIFSGTHSLTSFQDEPKGGLSFWDYEFIYDPKDFLSLNGKKWKTFRKNIKKHWPKDYKYRRLKDQDQDDVAELFLKWSEGKTLYDPETFTNFVLWGKNRWGLFLDGVLRGVNVFDTNWKYINYRICFDDGELYLNEYLRYKFYTSQWTLEQNKLVNDGGCLGSEGLERFKRKLNPIEVKMIYTGVENES